MHACNETTNNAGSGTATALPRIGVDKSLCTHAPTLSSLQLPWPVLCNSMTAMHMSCQVHHACCIVQYSQQVDELLAYNFCAQALMQESCNTRKGAGKCTCKALLGQLLCVHNAMLLAMLRRHCNRVSQFNCRRGCSAATFTMTKFTTQQHSFATCCTQRFSPRASVKSLVTECIIHVQELLLIGALHGKFTTLLRSPLDQVRFPEITSGSRLQLIPAHNKAGAPNYYYNMNTPGTCCKWQGPCVTHCPESVDRGLFTDCAQTFVHPYTPFPAQKPATSYQHCYALVTCYVIAVCKGLMHDYLSLAIHLLLDSLYACVFLAVLCVSKHGEDGCLSPHF